MLVFVLNWKIEISSQNSRCYYLMNHWTDTKLVCTHLNTFVNVFKLNPNIATNIWILNVFKKFFFFKFWKEKKKNRRLHIAHLKSTWKVVKFTVMTSLSITSNIKVCEDLDHDLLFYSETKTTVLVCNLKTLIGNHLKNVFMRNILIKRKFKKTKQTKQNKTKKTKQNKTTKKKKKTFNHNLYTCKLLCYCLVIRL